MANKQFWDIVKPFFSNKNLTIIFRLIYKNKIADNEVKLELLNIFYKCSRKYSGKSSD